MTPKPWTDADALALARLARSGRRAAEICAIAEVSLGRSSSEVLAQVWELMGNGVDMGPVERARFVLMGAAAPDAHVDGGWRLRGSPASTCMVVKAANVALGHFGKPPILYPVVEPKQARTA